ncbi:MAG: shikimate kinase [Lachnospiraceae bacterium]|nr:shikimate kinase [Lachnospiraceae bacterium]
MGNIILIGFMGCGKSTIGVKLSYRLRQPMLDTDKLIEKEEGRTISEIFETDGEEYFRNLETECIKKLIATVHNQIISVGGGLPMREVNHALLKELGMVVYLRAKAETIYERVKHDKTRPLLQCDDPKEKIRTLMKQRAAVYECASDVIVDVDNKDFDTILDEIVKYLQVRNKYDII